VNKPKVLIGAHNAHRTEVEMIIGLKNLGIDIHAALQSTSPFHQRLQEAGVPTRVMDLSGNIDIRGILEIRRWIKRENFDIAHGLANRAVANFIWASYGLENKVIAYRGAVGHVSRWDPSCYLKWLSPRIDKIICVSDAVKKDLKNNGVAPSKLVTIYKGHDPSWYEPTANEETIQLREHYSIPASSPLIGMVANMRRVKGADLLLKAMIYLPDNVHAAFVGEVRDREIEQLRQQPELRHRVHFTGYQANAAQLIKQFDINVAPSRGREGLTKTVIEAMIQGVPCVTSDAGGLPELAVHRETGLVFPIDDVVLFKKCLQELTRSKRLRQNLATKAKNHITLNFSTARTIQKTIRLYEKLEF
jgi:glycosyltransferase involved in cell wall biosynthesis